MMEEIIKNMKREIDMIEKENKENIEELISYKTSIEWGIGDYVLKYGTLWKIVVESNNLDECIKKLSNLYKEDYFNGFEDDIKEIIDKVVNACINRKNDNYFPTYTIDIQEELEHKIIDMIWKNCKEV